MVLATNPSLEPIDDTSFPIVLAGSLITTGTTIGLLCAHSFHPARSWKDAAVITAFYITTAAAVHLVAVAGLRYVFREHVQARFYRLLWSIWIPVAWLPLLGVLTARDSAWVLAVLPLLSVAATALLTQECSQDPYSSTSQPVPGMRLLLPEEKAFLRGLAPSLVTAVLLEAGFASSVAGHEWLAGLSFALACALPAWRLLESARRLGTLRVAIVTSFAVVLLTWIALLPMLLAAQFGGIASAGAPLHRPGLLPQTRALSGGGYSGIILLPPVPKSKPLPSPPQTLATTRSTVRQKPTVIPFDGVYWYFKAPASRPAPDARIVHADPLKANVRSTDTLPLRTEAHQKFPLPLPLRGASGLQLHVMNADTRLGSITAEVILHTHGAAPETTSLGTAVLASSVGHIALNRSPVREALHFNVPRRLRARSLDGITIRLIPEASRSLGGAEIAVEDFALLP